ncbi:MAG TPA: hypothetical protein PKA28_10770 [Methylomusa anaerophila]|uniref:hypothetical protein n=1 Tax=Methylomusa anaerophila TaxID=1930071 RepID=UPI002C441595|nr:hypothetical protein [Methylomusa anaerophila]HML88917.1 hypothetical protein [Methylomusa anaerophila]
MASIVYCNNILCRFNDNTQQTCSLDRVHYVDRRCMSFSKRRGESCAELMQIQRPNCHRSGGGYKSDRVRTAR